MNLALRAPVQVDGSSVVGEQCVFGYPKEARLRAEQDAPGSHSAGNPVVVGPHCLLANQVVLYEGAQIGTGCVIEDRVRIGYNCIIGDRTQDMTQAIAGRCR